MSDESTGSPSSLQSNLALGLHALAQPLAILRAKLYVESISRMNADELQKLALDSAGHVERLCTLFNYLQEIVLAEASEPELKACGLQMVLDHVFEGLDLWFEDSGIALERDEAFVDTVLADEKKLLQAISSLFMLLHAQCRRGDTVRVSTVTADQSVEMRLTRSRGEAKTLNAETRMALALVETNLRKQHGSLLVGPELSDVVVRVPSAPITT